MHQEIQKRIVSSLILIPLSFFFIIKGSFFFSFFLIIFFLLTSYEWYMMSKKKKYHLLGYLFLIFSFYSAFDLRNSFGDEGLIYFLFIIFICIATDIGGYVFGKIIKGPKIIRISPMIFVLFEYLELFLNINLKWKLEVYVYIFLISTISQTGDIIISYFKRLSNIKDTGKIIPGHGGVLDRIDGMIFAFPFSYIMFSLNILET